MAPIVRNKELMRIYKSCVGPSNINGRRQTLLVFSNQRKFQIGLSQNQGNERRTRMKPERMKSNRVQKMSGVLFVKIGAAKSCSNKRGQIDTTDVVNLSD